MDSTSHVTDNQLLNDSKLVGDMDKLEFGDQLTALHLRKASWEAAGEMGN